MERAGFSVVVVGFMNPAIHYPSWYTAGDEGFGAEEKSASQIVIVPQAAQFHTDHFVIQCLPNRWSVTTTDESHYDRALEIATLTFERLRETPVTAFGLNFEFAGDLGMSGDQVRVVVDALGGTAGDNKLTLHGFAMKEQLDDLRVENAVLRRYIVYNVRSDESPAKLRANIHNDIIVGGRGHFNLTPMLRSAWSMRESVERRASGFVGVRE